MAPARKAPSKMPTTRVKALLAVAAEIKDAVAQCCPGRAKHTSMATTYAMQAFHAKDMPQTLHQWCLELCKSNMQVLYESVWGWDEAKKKGQLHNVASRFLVALDETNQLQPVGYINYRFEREDGLPVLYCYELQIAKEAHRRGIGRWLMDTLEDVARGTNMSKIMLTVFKANDAALAFYRNAGYQKDETSPDNDDSGKEAAYLIMSKRM